MPELPDIVVYVESLERYVCGRRLEAIRIGSPFVLRSVDPPLTAAAGQTVTGIRRLGKRIVLALTGELYLIVHLMVAGRLRWRRRGTAIPKKIGQAALDFPLGTVLLTEAGSKKRASLHLVRGDAALAEHDPRGLEVFDADLPAFRGALSRESRTLKRALTDPTIVSGIGNAYSDEILHRARLSPFRLTTALTDVELARLFEATRATLSEWIERLRHEVGHRFPEKVTAFRDQMAVHGRYGRPCPVCGTAVQRLVYAEKESNYCPSCQTGGKLLADRALSRLFKSDWPQTVEELESRRRGGPGS